MLSLKTTNLIVSLSEMSDLNAITWALMEGQEPTELAMIYGIDAVNDAIELLDKKI